MHSTHANDLANPESLRLHRERGGRSTASFRLGDLLVVDATTFVGAGSCAVCGESVTAGGGIAALFEGRMLRFRCEGCLDRFMSDPDRYLGRDAEACCPQEAAPESPASEWCI